MRACGIEISSNAAVLALVEADAGRSVSISCATKKLKLDDEKDSTSLKAFQQAAASFLHENSVDVVVVKERLGKGPRGAHGVTFKIEALLQLAHPNVVFVHGKTLEKFRKTNAGAVPSDIKKYQHDAFAAGAWQLKQVGEL